MEVAEEQSDKEKTAKISEKENRLSKSLSFSSEDVVNESDKAQVTTKPTEKTSTGDAPEDAEQPSKNRESLSTSTGDVINESDKQPTPPKTLRAKLAKRTKSMSRIDHVTICSMDFQDVTNSRSKAPAKSKETSSKTQKEKSSKNKTSTQSFLVSARAIDEIMQVAEQKDKDPSSAREEKPPRMAKSNSESSESFFVSSGAIDEIMQVAEGQDKNPSKPASQPPESFMISARAIDEIMQVAEVADKNPFTVPAPIVDPKADEEKKRASGASNRSNRSKSPSLFSDSSFLDSQMCSILEKNVMDLSCLAEFERSNFTQQNQAEASKKTTRPDKQQSSTDISKENKPAGSGSNKKSEKSGSNEAKSQAKKSRADDTKHTTTMPPMTWTDDSWDQTRNLQQPGKAKDDAAKDKNEDSESPSLLSQSRARARVKPSASNIALSRIQAKSSKEKTPESPLIGSPRPIMPKRVFDKGDAERSPVAGVRSYNTRRPFMPSVSR